MPKSNDIKMKKSKDLMIEGESTQTELNLENDSVDNAINAYRKLFENNTEITEKQQEEIDQKCEVIRKRQVIYKETEHVSKEITSKNDGVVIGPPTLTRFEKARIMGARALQLSLGAPPFISISKDTSTSLEIALEELNRKLIPIIIRRVLPNDDYQNIPISHFK